jgi:hypothetical protein
MATARQDWYRGEVVNPDAIPSGATLFSVRQAFPSFAVHFD